MQHGSCWKMATACALPALICLLFARCGAGNNQAALWVNGEAVTVEELVAHAGLCRGKIPPQQLKDSVTAQVIAIRIKKQLALELGIIAGTSYRSFLQSLHEENKRRAAALRRGQVIYGPPAFDVTAYTGYYLSQLDIRIKQALGGLREDDYEVLLSQRARAAVIRINSNIYRQLQI